MRYYFVWARYRGAAVHVETLAGERGDVEGYVNEGKMLPWSQQLTRQGRAYVEHRGRRCEILAVEEGGPAVPAISSMGG